MKNSKITTTRSKSAFAIALRVVLMISMTCFPAVFAQDKRPLFAFVAVSPDEVKFGDAVLVTGWTSPQPPAEGGRRGGIRDNYMFYLTAPDGKTITVGPKSSFEDATCFFTYMPDQSGKWSIKLTYAGDELYQGCESPPFDFIVSQDAQTPALPTCELPTEYWSRPVYGENREWAQLLSDWPSEQYDAARSNFNPYGKAPNTAHILWTRPLQDGGIIGGK